MGAIDCLEVGASTARRDEQYQDNRGLDEKEIIMSKVWLITGAGRGMGVDIARAG